MVIHLKYRTLRLPYRLAADKAIVDNKAKVTEDQLVVFVNTCWTKYVKAKIEPGWFFLARTLPDDNYFRRNVGFAAVLLVLALVSAIRKRADWRARLAEAEAGEG